MENAHQEPRPEPRVRKPNIPHVDVMHAAAAGQLVITVHADVPDGFVIPAALGFEVRVAALVQELIVLAGLKKAWASLASHVGVLDDLGDRLDLALAPQEPAGVTEQEFARSAASETDSAAAEGASAAQDGQS